MATHKKKKKKLRGPLHLNTGGGSAATPSVTTGIPQGGHAQQALNTYFAGGQPPVYAADAGIGQGVQGAAPAQSIWQQPVVQQPVVQQPVTQTNNVSNAGGQGSGPAATQQFVPAAITNTTPAATYAGETYDTTQDTAGPLVTNPAVGKTTTYTPEQLEEITTDLSQSSLIPTEQRIADNTQYVDDVVSGGQVIGDVTVDPALISAGPNILDASQVGADTDGDGTDDYLQNFQGNYNTQYDHAQANPTGMSTGVPIYNQGFDFSDAGIDALLPPTGEADTSAGSTAWGPLAGIENFLAGIGGKNVQDTRYGVTGNRTAQQQANLEAFQANPTAAGAVTADRGSRGVRDARQAELRAEAGFSESAEDVAKWRGLSYPEKEAEIERNQTNQQHQAQAAATGAHDDQTAQAQAAYTQNIGNQEQTSYDNSVAKFGVEEANRLANQSGSSATQAQTQTAQAKLQAGVPAEVVREELEAESTGTTPAHSPAVEEALVANHGYTRQPDGSVRSPHFAVLGYNRGGPISGYNTGGQAMSPDELRRQQEAQAGKIAQSRLQATPPPPPKAPLQSGGGGGGGPGIAGQIGGQLLKTGLGAALGPFGAILGGLFNEGGAVQNLNQGGWLSKLFGGTGKPRTSRWGGEATKAPRTQTTGLPSRPLPGGINFTNPNRVKRDAQYAAHAKSGKPSIWQKLGLNTGGTVELSTAMRNMGGPLSMNPNGYNEGGQTQATPIKKVMDMEKLESQKMMDQQKLAQAEKAFMMAEGRKDEAAEQAMMQKEESHQQAMKLKKDSATMAGPLSGGK